MSQSRVQLPDLLIAYDRATRPEVRATILGNFVCRAMAERQEALDLAYSLRPSIWVRWRRRAHHWIAKKINKTG